NNDNTRTDLTIAGGAQMSDHWSAEAAINYINNAYQNQPAQAYEEIDPMQGFIWFGRQVDTRILKDNLNRDPNDPLTKQIVKGNPNLRTDAPIPYSWNYSYHPSPYWEATANAGGNARVNDLRSSTGIVSRLVIPAVYTMGNSDGSPTDSFHVVKKKVNSLYGLASFNYKDWLNVDVTGRNDWFSTLPNGQNSIFYPSVGGAFIFTDALRVQSDVLSYGKLRASWTRVGNDTDPYQLAAVYASGTAWGGQPTFTAPDRLPNANLKPEQTTGEEVGVDLEIGRASCRERVEVAVVGGA